MKKEDLLELSNNLEADLYLFNSTVTENSADEFVHLIRGHADKKANCALFLTTYGGDPDAGYRMVRIIKRYYSKLILFVCGSCKSTGTLIALGADEIIMGDFGELGPLDIQLAKDDEMLSTSGLSYLQSLASLSEQLFPTFEKAFFNIKQRSGYTITTRTAAEIASKLTVGLVSPISAQIDPVKLGEVQRAIQIADAYGRRLTDKEDLITYLIAGYPSHGFVIDFEEAESIFPNVRLLNDKELLIEHWLFPYLRRENGQPAIFDLTKMYLKSMGQVSDADDEKNQEPSMTQTGEEETASDEHKSPQSVEHEGSLSLKLALAAVTQKDDTTLVTKKAGTNGSSQKK
ncbi:SDH family Clp fold serine proteinase [Hymenobacter sp. 102]|uniref:SDH family Clp fold serine proteinase n=1 Tax=Hymenobacter sp. 102 TaxID=3403152 RepID=UPI003CF5FD06